VADEAPTAVVLADGAPCAACLAEVGDPEDRRFGYPFTNCTECGPRFTIVTGLPYDRPLTTMAAFTMCAACEAEYRDPADRRFHAQPNACPECGPRVWFAAEDGVETVSGAEAFEAAARALRDGRIVAAKGLGGFHLLVDAGNEEAVVRLRRRKSREEKPLALMVRDLGSARELCDVSDRAAALLSSAEAPIVLMPARDATVVAPSVAPGNPRLGVMLPPTPFHHLLLAAFPQPVVATSGNRSEEPICTSNDEALDRLAGIADVFLLHDRPIARHVDDSVVGCDASGMLPLRRARGYAPLPISVPPGPCVLALGGHLKNTVALALRDQVFLSQHIGDLDTPRARDAFVAVIRDFLSMYGAEPVMVAHDLHPDYASTRWIEDAAGTGEPWRAALGALPRVAVQHHHAHLASCLAENEHDGPALAFTWDGTGYGPDGTVWGGECLLGDAAGFERVASLRPFALPGGHAAVHEPRRVAIALLRPIVGEDAWDTAPGRSFEPRERALLGRMLEQGVNAPVTTSMGRLFDSVAALLGLRERVAFEGQAAMELEHVAASGEHGAYPLPLTAADGPARLDWEPLLRAVVRDVDAGTDPGVVSARFHETLVTGIVSVAQQVGQETVALTGGCFQNRRLSSQASAALAAAGFRVLRHREVPPGDGGVSLGQVAVARAAANGER
jgi:hydrogenase maturation protein HypF